MPTNIEALRARLQKVNTQLNLIEDGWPHRRPTTKRSTLKIDTHDSPVAKYALEEVERLANLLLVKKLRGWEFTVYVHTWGGQDSGAMVEIFANGQSFASVRYFSGDEPHLKTAAQCMQACIGQAALLFENASKRLAKYPLRTFQSAKYERLCEQRRKLNSIWHDIPETRAAPVPGPYAYPYGEHKPGWPVFEGLQLGK